MGRKFSQFMENEIDIVHNIFDKGYIRLVDYMGTEDNIVNAARQSYGEGTKKVSSDTGLIRSLTREWHTAPFEHPKISLQIMVPMDVWRQWIRHRTASVSEYSTRYSIAIEDKVITDFGEWRIQSTNSKQGSDGYLNEKDGKYLSEMEKQLHDFSDKVYKERLNFNVAREQARKDLPLSNYTLATWTIDVHNLMHFLRLRMANDAQLEIRRFANFIGENYLANWLPNVWKALLDYRINAITFSVEEQKILSKILRLQNFDINILNIDFINTLNVNMSKREKEFFIIKIYTIWSNNE